MTPAATKLHSPALLESTASLCPGSPPPPVRRHSTHSLRWTTHGQQGIPRLARRLLRSVRKSERFAAAPQILLPRPDRSVYLAPRAAPRSARFRRQCDLPTNLL